MKVEFSNQAIVAHGANTIVFAEDAVLLMQSGSGWKFPGGTYDEAIDTNLHKTSVRELAEEAAIALSKVGECVYAYTKYEAPKKIGHVALFSDYYFAYTMINAADTSMACAWIPQKDVLEKLSSDEDKAAFRAALITKFIK